MNEGLKAATGDIVTFICHDDLYEDDGAIGHVVDIWNRMPDYDAICGGMRVVDEKGDTLLERRRYIRWPASIIKHIDYLPHCSLFCARHRLLERSLYFDPELPYVADAEWAMRLVECRLRIKYSERIVSRNRMHKQQRTHNDRGEAIWTDIRKMQKRYDLSPFAYKAARIAQYTYQRLFSCCDDLRDGKLRTALNRLFYGTYYQLKQR